MAAWRGFPGLGHLQTGCEGPAVASVLHSHQLWLCELTSSFLGLSLPGLGAGEAGPHTQLASTLFSLHPVTADPGSLLKRQMDAPGCVRSVLRTHGQGSLPLPNVTARVGERAAGCFPYTQVI